MSVKKDGKTIRVMPEELVDLRKIGGELQAKNGHSKTDNEVVKFLISEHRKLREIVTRRETI